jgi:hypothetical protein
MLTFYIDETGFTGEDLLAADQPVFATASNDFSAAEAEKIAAGVFGGVEMRELKYKNLGRRENHRQRVLEFIRVLAADPLRAGTWSAHKEYGMTTMIVEWWIEPHAYRDGVNLYENGGNHALANLLFVCLEGFWSREFRKQLLLRFQRMFRARTKERFVECWEFVERAYTKANKRQADILVYLLPQFRALGMRHVAGMPARALDLGLTCLVSTASWWRSRHEGPFEVVHDNSSNMAKQKQMWDDFSSPALSPARFENPAHPLIFPLNVTSTRFADSAAQMQIQLCDILAGATGERLRALAVGAETEFSAALQEAGLHKLMIGTMWPSTDVTAEALERKGWDGNFALNHITEVLMAKDKENAA